MIRATLIAGLTALLLLMLYLPSAYPPERFVHQVNEDYAAITNLWGPDKAETFLDFALQTRDTLQGPPSPPKPAPSMHGALELAAMSERLFRNSYFRSIEALAVMAMFRIAAMGVGQGWLFVLGLAAFVDASARRIVRSKQFEHHDPERLGLYLLSAALTIIAALMAAVFPVPMNPWAWATVPPALLICLSRAWGMFHRP